jgi:hypothetical protein
MPIIKQIVNIETHNLGTLQVNVNEDNKDQGVFLYTPKPIKLTN